jgi:transposase
MDGKQLQQQHKNHISDYKEWEQQAHASEWMLFERSVSAHLSEDEAVPSNDEPYTVVTNKAAKRH